MGGVSMATITNDWDLVLGTNQQFYSTLLTSLYDDGTIPHSVDNSSCSLLLGEPTAALSSASDALAVTIPVLTGSYLMMPGMKIGVEGSMTITIALASVGLSCVIQNDYLQPNGGSAAAG